MVELRERISGQVINSVDSRLPKICFCILPVISVRTQHFTHFLIINLNVLSQLHW